MGFWRAARIFTRSLYVGQYSRHRLRSNAHQSGQTLGCVVFFDFKAAFPSEDHDYLLTVLEHIG
eukprot:7810979-Pyramimonas_sp.AAC.1